jgi:hypothetical protein
MFQYYGILLILKTAAYFSFSSDFYITKLVLQIEKPPATAENYPKKKEDSNIVVGLMVFFGEPLYITWIVKNLHSHTINFNQAWRNTNWLSKGMKKEQ